MLRMTILGLSLLFGFATSADAAVITAADIPAGNHAVTLADGTVVTAWQDAAGAQAAVFGPRSQDGTTGFGVGGAGNNEIDHVGGNAGSEMVRVAFANATTIASLTLGLLFDGPEYGDGYETATISFAGMTGTLRAIAADLAEWTVGGTSVTVAACTSGATLEGGSGCFTILNPFASLTGTGLEFTAAQSGAADESDYLVAAIDYVPIPEPAPAALIILGALALIARGRRR